MNRHNAYINHGGGDSRISYAIPTNPRTRVPRPNTPTRRPLYGAI